MDKNKIIETAAKLIAKGAYDKAIREYQRILEVDSKDVRILQKLGELHQKRNDNVQAAQCFARVAESYTSEGFYLKAVALYKQVLRLDPNLVEINLTLAQLHQQLQLSGEAIAYLQVLLSHYEQLADLPKCVEILRRIVGLDPESVAFRTKLAGLYERSSDIVAAVSEFREVATVLRRLGRVDDFVRVAEHLSGLDPKDIQLARELATIYLGRGDHKRALAKLQLCFKADNRDVETLRILATTLEGLKQIPKTISVYKGLAHILEESGDVTEAMKVWKQVGRLDPQDPQYLEHKANSPDAADEVGSGEHTDGDATVRVGKLLSETVVYSKYGLFQKALEHLAKVFAIAPENIDAHERAYEIYVAQGDHERSFEQLLNVLRLHTRSGDRKRAQPFLETILRERPDHPEVVTFVAELGSAEEAFTGPTNDVKPPPPPLPGRAAPTQRTFVPPRAPGKSHLLTETTVPGLPTAKRTPSSPRAVPPPPPPRKTPSRPHAAMPLPPPPPPRQTPSRPRTAIPLVPNPASHQATQAPPAGPALKLGRPGQPAAPHPVAPPQVTQIKAPPPPPKFAKPKEDVLPPPPRAPGGLPKSPSQIIAPPPNAPVRLEARPPPAPREQPLPLKPLADLPAPQFKKPERAPLPIDEEQLAEIDFFTEQGLHDEARSILQALLDKSPEHPQLLERLKALEPKQSEDPTPKIAAELDELSDEIGELEAIPAPSFQISAEEVISEFKKGISRVVKAKDVETHYDLGMAYKEMGLFDDALQEFSTARQQCIGKPKEINCLSMIGLVHSLKGDSAQAIAVYQEALALPGAAGHAECALRYELGKVFEASGAYGKALAQYLKAQAIDRGFREVSSDVERLSAEVSPEEDTPPARHPPRRVDSK